MAYNDMPQIPNAPQQVLAITATQFSSFATPAITVPFPSAYGGQTQLPYSAWSGTATYAATRVPTTLGGIAATAGVHSINEAASAAGYRTHDYGNQGGGGGGGWPTWATAVIASVGGAALVVVVAGLWCWRWRRKQRARSRAKGYAVGGGGKGGKKGKGGLTAHRGGGADLAEKRYTDSPERNNRPRSAFGGAATVPGLAVVSPTKSRSRSRQSGYDSPAGSYPPQPTSSHHSSSPSRSRARDLAALGINRPSSTTPSRHFQQPSPSACHPPQHYPHPQHTSYDSPSAGLPDSPVYPSFAVPRSVRQTQHERNLSDASSVGELLPPPAPGFSYVEGPGRRGYETPPPSRPNTNWDESPAGGGSPARLLAFGPSPGGASDGTPVRAGAGAGGYPESPRSVSTRGTGGAPYRWDGDEVEHDPMPDAGAVSAALGRAMMGSSSSSHHHGEEDGYAPVGLAVGAPEDARRWASEEDYRHFSTGGGGGGGLAPGYREKERSTTPSYPPPLSAGHEAPASDISHSQYTASRAPSRTTVRGGGPGGREAAFLAAAGQPVPSLSAHSHAHDYAAGVGRGGARSTTPYGEPPPDSARTGGTGGMSRTSTYRTAEEGEEDEEDRRGTGPSYGY
ncbi:hypothetical protein JCM8547_005594 [Rhodosporidiobolus lusitaniae]